VNRPQEVHVDDPPPVREAEVAHLDVVGARDVERLCLGRAAVGAHRTRRLVGAGRVDVRDHDHRVAPAEPRDERASDPACAARDDRGARVEGRAVAHRAVIAR
jgi:hypothetical protein